MVKLSIVIPAYQCESTIRKCMDRLITPDKSGEYEIIAVNDGSRDATLTILREYEQKCPDVIVINQDNQGVSAARNAGIWQASGEYVTFVDSDDYTESSFVASIVEMIKDPADLIVFNSDKVSEDGTAGYPNFSSEYVGLDKEGFYEHILRQKLNQPWGKLFRMNILRKHQILYQSEISIGEDLTFLMAYFRHVRSVRFCDMLLYHYLHNANSLSHSSMTEKRVQQFMRAYLAQEALLIDPGKNKHKFMVSYINSIFRSVMLTGNVFRNMCVWKRSYQKESKLNEVFQEKYDFKTEVKKLILRSMIR